MSFFFIPTVAGPVTTSASTDSAPAAAPATTAAAAVTAADDTGKPHAGPPGLLSLRDRVAPSSAEGL